MIRSCVTEALRFDKRLEFVEVQVSNVVLLPSIVPLPKVRREPFPCIEPPIFDFKIERIYTKLPLWKVLNAISIDNDAKTIVVSTLDLDFIGQEVSLRITIEQALTDRVDEKLVIIEFVPPKDEKLLIFEPIPLTSRVMGTGVKGVTNLSVE